jgi:hypothetical protein
MGKERRNLEDVLNGRVSGVQDVVLGAAKLGAAKLRLEALRNLEQVHGESVLPTEVLEFVGNFGFVAQGVNAVLVALGVDWVHSALLRLGGGTRREPSLAIRPDCSMGFRE